MVDQVVAGALVLLGLGIGVAAIAKPVGEIASIIAVYLLRLYSGLRRGQHKN